MDNIITRTHIGKRILNAFKKATFTTLAHVHTSYSEHPKLSANPTKTLLKERKENRKKNQ